MLALSHALRGLGIGLAIVSAGLTGNLQAGPDSWLQPPATASRARLAVKQSASAYVGLRRSSYGLPKLNQDDHWWAARAREYAASLAAQPALIQIISHYAEDGSTVFEFDKPAAYTGSTAKMTFVPGPVNHERALATYDREGVRAILQFEPGNADMTACLTIAYLKFGGHACVAGFGLDAEWYFTRESADGTGRPVPDSAAEQWMSAITSVNPAYTMFLKHWNPEHMPPAYRHPNLWFLSDAQQFQSLTEMLEDFDWWGTSLSNATVGFQYGYDADRTWWQALARPTVEIAQAIQAGLPQTRYFFWVDFTANKVTFK